MYNGAEKHFTWQHLENATSRANENVILMSQKYVC